MSVQLVNGHVLLPTRPNWSASISWKRTWQTTISSALQGQEERRALRRIPRVTLNWLITTLSAEETAVLETRIQAALKSGLACTGYWGRSCEIKTDVTGTSAALWPGSWPWAAGDHILFVDPDTGLFDAIKVDEVAGNTLTLHAAVSRSYAACALCWPIIFGKLQTDALAPFTADKAEVKLTLLNALPSPAVVPSCDDWCGHCNAALAPVPGSPCSAEVLAECIPLFPPTGLTVAGADTPCPTAAISTLTPTLSWDAVSGAGAYVVEIFAGSCGGTLIHTSEAQFGASYALPAGLLNWGTTYYWRVKALAAKSICDSAPSDCCAITTSCPTITLDDALPDGEVGVEYSGTVTASGGTGPYSYVRTAGAIPPGLTLAGNGTLSGTPTVCGDYTFSITATDADGCTGTRAYGLHIARISDAPCADCAGAAPAASVGGLNSTAGHGTGDQRDGNGDYGFESFDVDTCTWLFRKGSGQYSWTLAVQGAYGTWAFDIEQDGIEFGVGYDCSFQCDCGTLSGSCSAPGGLGTITVSLG